MNFIFDLYGTLVDIWTDESCDSFWQGVCGLIGCSPDSFATVRAEYAQLCKSKKQSQYHEIELSEVFEDIISAHGAKISSDELARGFRRLSMRHISLFPHVKQMLTSLKNVGAGVYIVSNAQSCFTRYEIDFLGLTELFDGIILSSEEGVKKPSKMIFERAFDRFNITCEDSCYVGNDLYDDVYGAKGAGLRTVYIETRQSGSYADMPRPDHTAADHKELYDLLISLAVAEK